VAILSIFGAFLFLFKIRLLESARDKVTNALYSLTNDLCSARPLDNCF